MRDLDTYLAQATALADHLDALPAAAFAQPSVLPGWDVRILLAHVVSVHLGLARVLSTRSELPALPAADYVRRYAVDAAAIDAGARDTAAARSAGELRAMLHDDAVLRGVLDVPDRTVLSAPRGAVRALNWVRTRVLELVVHCDDMSRSLPDAEPVPLTRAATALAVRTLAEILAAQAPGRSVELRVPPFVAVQAVSGPRHTRGTPPNVVETDPVTWLRVATGRIPFTDEVAAGRIRATGNRADLTPYLPVLA